MAALVLLGLAMVLRGHGGNSRAPALSPLTGLSPPTLPQSELPPWAPRLFAAGQDGNPVAGPPPTPDQSRAGAVSQSPRPERPTSPESPKAADQLGVTVTTPPPTARSGAVRLGPISAAPGSLRRVFLVGDSLTWQYGPVLARRAGLDVTMIGGPGQNPATSPWTRDLVTEVSQGRPDVIVLQDWERPGISTPATMDQWTRAWADLVNEARASGARVITLVGPSTPNADVLSAMPTEHFDMVASDYGDGIHWTEAGSSAMAGNLFTVLVGAPPG